MEYLIKYLYHHYENHFRLKHEKQPNTGNLVGFYLVLFHVQREIISSEKLNDLLKVICLVSDSTES